MIWIGFKKINEKTKVISRIKDVMVPIQIAS